VIYILAFFLPPLALLIEGKLLAALLNLVIVVIGLVLAVLPFITLGVLMLASAHAIIVIAQSRRRREHRELVEAARQGRAPLR